MCVKDLMVQGNIMSKKFVYDPENKTIFLKRSGRLMPGELSEGIQNLIKLSEFNEAQNLLSDFRDCDLSGISNSEVRNHAEYCKDRLKHLNVVIISPSDLGFGLGRMFEILSELGMVKVVKNLKEALEILKIDRIPEY